MIAGIKSQFRTNSQPIQQFEAISDEVPLVPSLQTTMSNINPITHFQLFFNQSAQVLRPTISGRLPSGSSSVRI